MSGRKEDNISAKILDSIVSGLNDEPDQETTTSEIGKRNASFSLIPHGYDTEPSVSVSKREAVLQFKFFTILIQNIYMSV